MNRVYVPAHHQFGKISGRVFRGFPGVVIPVEYRISLDDGRSILVGPDDFSDADNVAVLHPRRPLSPEFLDALSRVGPDPGPDAA